jgi:hypothetical protein
MQHFFGGTIHICHHTIDIHENYASSNGIKKRFNNSGGGLKVFDTAYFIFNGLRHLTSDLATFQHDLYLAVVKNTRIFIVIDAGVSCDPVMKALSG